MKKTTAKIVATRVRPELFPKRSEPVTAIAKFVGYYSVLYVARICDSHYPHLRPQLDQVIARMSPARHSEDFTSVHWFGTPFSFTPLRAKIVRVWFSRSLRHNRQTHPLRCQARCRSSPGLRM